MLDQLTSMLYGLGPWGIVVGIGISILGKVYGPSILDRLKGIVPLTAPSVPAPSVPAGPAPSSTPLMDAAVSVLKNLAMKRFPFLSTDEAAHRFVGELVNADDVATAAKAASAAAKG